MTTSHPAGRGAPGRQSADLLVLGLFYLSGASALIYEVVWGRLLTFIFGGTAFAIATVLAAYMAGLAIGSWVFGRRIDRGGRPLMVYAALEAGIGVWALILPLVLALLNGFYGVLYRGLNPGPYALSLIRFLLSFIVLVVPTILMGGTLPVLSKLLVGGRRVVGLKTGLLYGTNTIGAVTGAAVSGFLLIPFLGMRTSTWIAVFFNLAVALLAVALQRATGLEPVPAAGEPPEEAPSGKTGTPGGDTTRLKRTVLFVYAASGFAALAYEVAWTKVLSGALGTTTYAFSAMLTTFLLGLAIGAFIMARLADRHDPGLLLAWSQLAIAVLGLAALPLFGNMPVLFVKVFKTWGSSWGTQTLARFALCALTMLIPTILMGGAFPLVARLYADRMGRMGKQIGELYSANTLGAILGSFSAGFILVPLIGRQGTILAAVAVNLVSAAVLYLTLAPTLTRRARLVAGATALVLIPAVVFGARPWDRYLMVSGAYVYADQLAHEPDIRKAMHDQLMVHYEEDTEAILAVMRAEHVLSLRTGGKVEASTAGDMITQEMISHLPLLFHRQPSDVLMIGLASGISFGTVLDYPQVRRADCVEMLGGMRRVADLFRKYNQDCLADPRTRLIINDGRNHLLLTRDRYDVIISQPSNPWIVGIGSLFTRDFFELGARRLKPGGIFCQWVQMYQMSRRDFSSVLRTFHEVFPQVSIWMGAPGDVILLGSADPLSLSYRRLEEQMAVPRVRDDLARVGVESTRAFLQGYLGADRTREALSAPGGPVITDNNLLLEFSMPHNLYNPKVEMMSILLMRDIRELPTTFLTLEGVPADSLGPLREDLARWSRGRSLAFDGIDLSIGREHGGAIRILEEARRLAPGDPLIAQYLGNSRNEVGIQLLQGGQEEQALVEFRRATAVGSRSEQALAWSNIGLHHYTAGRVDSAEVCWRRAADLEPESPIIRFNLALLHEGAGRPDLAEKEYRTVLEVSPDNAAALNNLAWLLGQRRDRAAEAADLARRAVSLDASAGNLDTWGWTLRQAGRLPEAEKTLRRALAAGPDDMQTLLHLGLTLADRGKRAEARTALERVAGNKGNEKLALEARQALEKP